MCFIDDGINTRGRIDNEDANEDTTTKTTTKKRTMTMTSEPHFHKRCLFVLITEPRGPDIFGAVFRNECPKKYITLFAFISD